MMKKLTFLMLMLFALDAKTQTDTTKKATEVILGAYADTYYTYYLNGEPNTQQVHNCVGAYNQTFGLNIAQMSAEVKHEKLRGKVTLQFGDIPNIAWTGVSAMQEAYGGIKLGKHNWLDLGFFKTHIGAESFLPKDNLMSQLALATFYGPFYQSGVRFIHQSENGWDIEGHLISGYNRQIDNNNKPSIGVLVAKEFSPKLKISYANLFGQEEISLHRGDYLFYNNIYTNFSFGKWQAQISADVATQFDQNPPKDNILIASLATFKRQIKGAHSIAFRGEWFYDPSSINSRNYRPIAHKTVFWNIASYNSDIQLIRNKGLNIFGGTIGYEYKPSELGYLRIESRYLYNLNTDVTNYPEGFNASEVGIDGYLKNRLGAMVTIGVYFDKKLTFAP